MPSVGSALIHEARVVRTVRAGARDVQGEREPVEQLGPWFPARIMPRRPSREAPPDPGGAKRSERPLSLIWGDEDDDGNPLDPPRASDVVEVARELADGSTETRRYTITGPPSDYDAGGGPFGGQAELVVVVEAS